MAKPKKAKAQSKIQAKAQPTAPVTPPTHVASSRLVGSGVTLHNDPALHGYKGVEAPNLAGYERAMRVEPVFAAAIRYLTLSMLASLGEYYHPNPEIQAFVRKNFDRMEGNLQSMLGELIHSALWSGKGVSELTFAADKGKWWLKNATNYHPASVALVPNRRGQLVDNSPDVALGSTFKRSGVYQQVPLDMGVQRTAADYVRIPMAKCVVVKHRAYQNNLHGQSMFAPAWLFYEMKWATLESWMVTSEKYGAPTVAAIVPSGITSSMVSDGAGGMRPQTVAEGARDALSNMRAADGLVFERPPGGGKDDIILQPLTTGNNFGDSYHMTIKAMDFQMFTAMGVPPLLFMEHTGGLGAGEISQTQADNFKQNLVSLNKEIIEPFTEQCIGRLVFWNFGVRDPGRFPFKPFDPGAAARAMQTIDMALKDGLIDVSQPEDLQHARTLIGWAPADGKHLDALLRGNKTLMKNLREPDALKLKATEVAAGAVVETKEIEVEANAAEGDKDRQSKEKIAKMKPAPKPAPKKKAS